MRARGVRAVPAGPRAATRGNPAGLTSRQMQVLTLMAAGLDNAEIGARLHISAKTAEHHVGAVLAAFGASTRQRAVEAARARGVLRDDGES
jgi:DNA-binding NarL/FixJ family response regulator